MKSPSEKIDFKILVKKGSKDMLLDRIQHSATAMKQAQESANAQEKSSVGDKHETSRSISQAESAMNSKQLLQAIEDLKFIEAIDVNKINAVIATGSVFIVSGKLFFVAVGLGAILAGEETVMVISHRSPLFLKLKAKSTGDKIFFQNEEVQITCVF